MIRFIMISQLVFFFIAGTQIVEHEKKCARTEEAAMWIIKYTPAQLSEERI